MEKIPLDIKKISNVLNTNFGGVPALYHKVWTDLKILLSETDYLLFMHDDTIIKNIRFIEKLKNY